LGLAKMGCTIAGPKSLLYVGWN